MSGRKQFVTEGGNRIPISSAPRLLSLRILPAGCPAAKASPRVPLLHLVLTSVLYLLTTDITIIGISIKTRTAYAFSPAGGQSLSRRREGVDAASIISSRQQRYDGEGRQGNQPPLHLAPIRRATTINQ